MDVSYVGNGQWVVNVPSPMSLRFEATWSGGYANALYIVGKNGENQTVLLGGHSVPQQFSVNLYKAFTLGSDPSLSESVAELYSGPLSFHMNDATPDNFSLSVVTPPNTPTDQLEEINKEIDELVTERDSLLQGNTQTDN